MVSIHITPVTQVEKKIKFSHTDTSSPSEQSPKTGGRKVKSKSSTLSLHTLAREEEEEDEPMLQRRNSIHNVSMQFTSVVIVIFNPTRFLLLMWMTPRQGHGWRDIKRRDGEP